MTVSTSLRLAAAGVAVLALGLFAIARGRRPATRPGAVDSGSRRAPRPAGSAVPAGR